MPSRSSPLSGDMLRNAAHAPKYLANLVANRIDLEIVRLAQCHAELKPIDRIQAETTVEQGLVAVDVFRLYVLEIECGHNEPLEFQLEVRRDRAFHDNRPRDGSPICALRERAGCYPRTG